MRTVYQWLAAGAMAPPPARYHKPNIFHIPVTYRSQANTEDSGIMRSFIVAGILSVCSMTAAAAQSPVGEWVVEDATAHIRIVSCGSALWGVISWTKDAPGTDENNPDPSKRSRSVMGMPILLNMKPAGQRWDGEVYNAENGETYTAHISLESPDVLRIEGCVLGGLFCGGENWKRVNLPSSSKAPSSQDVCSRVATQS
jgi:uncharacterized protein (DUF2147 family)